MYTVDGNVTQELIRLGTNWRETNVGWKLNKIYLDANLVAIELSWKRMYRNLPDRVERRLMMVAASIWAGIKQSGCAAPLTALSTRNHFFVFDCISFSVSFPFLAPFSFFHTIKESSTFSRSPSHLFPWSSILILSASLLYSSNLSLFQDSRTHEIITEPSTNQVPVLPNLLLHVGLNDDDDSAVVGEGDDDASVEGGGG